MEDFASSEATVQPQTEKLMNIDFVYLKKTQHQRLLTQAQEEKQIFSNNGVSFSYFRAGINSGPAIIALHDVGQDSIIGFGSFFNQDPVSQISKEMSIYYVNLPGQSPFDQTLSVYPTFDEIAEAILLFIKSLNRALVVGFGIGAGANILLRVSLLGAHVFSRLIFVNGYISSMGWSEWFYQKFHTFDANCPQVSPRLISHLFDHFFNKNEPETEIHEFYSLYLTGIQNSTNLLLLLNAFASRTAIHLESPIENLTGNLDYRVSVVCPTLLIISEDVIQYDDCIQLRELIPPSILEYIEFKDAHGFVMDQFPKRVAQAFVLFIQGMGYRNLFF